MKNLLQKFALCCILLGAALAANAQQADLVFTKTVSNPAPNVGETRFYQLF